MLKRDENSRGMLKLNPLSAAIAAAFAYAAAPQVAVAQTDDGAEDEEAVDLGEFEVTGSRLGRADIEGALPVAVIDRADIERSGFTSVGELLRNTTFNTFGAFRAQSGSSAQSLVSVSLRGLGSERTLVLIDGRRAPKAPFAPSAQDLNAVPIAVVERIEILKDGASAIYGSDAIAGVVNIITRKDFSGTQITYQDQTTAREGGDSRGGQITSGISGEKGNIVFGASFFEREIIFARDSLYNTPGASFFSNNFSYLGLLEGNVSPDFNDADGDYFDDDTGFFLYEAVPGGCPNPTPGYFAYPIGVDDPSGDPVNLCGYDFTLVSADEAETGSQGLFVQGNYQFSDNWGVNVNASITRATSFGRYAPSLNDVQIAVDANSPNNPVGEDLFLYHRFAGLGPRDNKTDANVYDVSGIFSGVVGPVDLDIGVRHNEYRFYELGSNYVVIPIAEQFINDGSYDIFNPAGNPDDVLNAMKATVTRDSKWITDEAFVEASMDLFDMAGGTSAAAVGLEYREESYFDQYDSLQEAGVIGGTAGNSAGTDRRVKSAFFEMFMPAIDSLEVTLSGRYEDYNDSGTNFAPKLSARYQPLSNMTVRASVGQGFRAPTLDVISQLPTPSAESINNDEATCRAAGGTFSGGTCSTSQQVSTIILANPELEAEESDQYAVGFAMDVTSWFNFSVDYYNITIDELISFISPGEIVAREAAGDPIPAGLRVERQAPSNRIVRVVAGYANDGKLETDGIDVSMDFNFAVPGNLGTIKSHLEATHVLSYEQDGGRNQAGDPGAPDLRVTLDNAWTFGPVTAAINGNYISDYAQGVEDGRQTGNVPSYTTWDVQVGYDIPFVDGTIALGALNVFDRNPPEESAGTDGQGRNYNFDLYDQYGRQPYVKYTQRF